MYHLREHTCAHSLTHSIAHLPLRETGHVQRPSQHARQSDTDPGSASGVGVGGRGRRIRRSLLVRTAASRRRAVQHCIRSSTGERLWARTKRVWAGIERVWARIERVWAGADRSVNVTARMGRWCERERHKPVSCSREWRCCGCGGQPLLCTREWSKCEPLPCTGERCGSGGERKPILRNRWWVGR